MERAVRKMIVFLQGQRIHVRPKTQAPLALTSFDHSNNPCASNTRVDINAPRPQTLCHQCTGPVLLKPKLRMSVNIASERHKRRNIRKTVNDVHGLIEY
jgi:hypothetical protein